MRSRKVSILTGAFGVLLFIIAVFVFLWNFWFKDIFRDAERVEVPDFVGSDYEDIINNREFSILISPFTMRSTRKCRKASSSARTRSPAGA
jgi:hypothetical protein